MVRRDKVPLEDQAEYLVTQWMSVKQFEAAGGLWSIYSLG